MCVMRCIGSVQGLNLWLIIIAMHRVYVQRKLLKIEQEIKPSKYNNNSLYISLPGENLSGGLTRVPLWDQIMIQFCIGVGSDISGSVSFPGSETTWRWDWFLFSPLAEVSTRGSLAWATTLPLLGLVSWPNPYGCIHMAVSSVISGISLLQ